MVTDAWPLEGATIGEGDEVANSLAARILLLQASITDVTAIKAVTDVLPDAGALTSISDETDKIDAIKTVTDVLPDAGALTSISDETDKIDGAATDGLAGTNNSLAYRVHEIERHFHGWERWFGLAGAPDAELHRADRIGTTVTAFQADAGNLTWGTWLQILGSDDTPADGGMAKLDLHQIQIVTVERAGSEHFVQVALGASGAAALASGDYTEIVFQPQGAQARKVAIPIMTRRKDAGTKAWLRCLVVGQNTGTMDFFIGIHEYPGS